MSATTVGTIGLNMVLNSAGFKRSMQNVQSQANTASQKMAASFRKIGASIAAAFSAKMIASFGKSCIDLGSDLAEVQNVVDVTFSSMSNSVNEWAKNAAKSYGLSETMAKKYVGTFGSMAEAFGFTEKQSYDMATTLTGLTGDVASFYNLTQDEAYTKLKSVFSGETESLKDLGVVMTQSALDSYALANGYGKTISAMTEAEKVTLRYKFVQDQLKNATGDFARTQDSWANQTRILQLRFDSLKATIGQGLINAFTPVIKVVNSLIDRLTTVSEKFKALTEQIFGSAGNSAEAAAGSIASATNSVNSLTGEAEGSSSALDGIADSAEKAKRSIAGFDKLNIISENKTDSASNTPTSTATSNVSGSNVTSNVANTANKGLNNAFKNLYEKSGFKTFVDNVQKGINKVDWSAIGENCKSIFQNSVPIVKTSLEQIRKVGAAKLGAIGSMFGALATVGGKSFQTLSGSIAKWLDKDSQKIKTFINNIGNNLTAGYNNLSAFWDNLGTVVGNSIDEMRPTMENAISDLLGGLTTFAGNVGEICSEAFSIATANLVTWIENDEAEFTEFFNNIQGSVADVMSFIGGVFEDIGTILGDWWNGEGGKEIFDNVCQMFTDIGTTLMNVYNEWIQPAIDFIIDIFQSAWDNCLRPIFDKLVSFFGKICECISTVWNNFLSPLVNWIVEAAAPKIESILTAVKNVFDTVFTFIGDIIGSVIDYFSGLIDFLTGVFSLDFEKMCDGLNEMTSATWDAIWGTIKFVVNLIIDGINLLWTGIYNVAKGVVDSIGGIAGAIGNIFGQDWHFSMPDDVPLIPKLAKGGIVKAPTLAVVGDNAGANTGNPEVIAPLNKLQTMINNSGGQDVAILTQILDYLKRIYEMFIIFRNNGGNMYEFVAKLNNSTLFNEIVNENELYKKRHNGKSAFL